MQPNNPVPAKRAAGKIRSVRQAVACALAVLALAVTPLPATAGDPGLHMELKKVENVDGRCRGVFMLRSTRGPARMLWLPEQVNLVWGDTRPKSVPGRS